MDTTPAGHEGCTIDSPTTPAALLEINQWLRCPHCAATLRPGVRNLACPSEHSFDIARQGYASLLRGGRRRHRGDSAAMVSRREHFLGQDHYRPLRTTLTSVAVELAPTEPRLVLDLAGGTGHYLSALLDGLTRH